MFARICALNLLLVCAWTVPAPAQFQSPSGWKAGVARIKITPDTFMWMSGYAARDKPAEGARHDLWAKALAMEDAKGHRIVLVTMDLVGIDRGLSLAVRDSLQKNHKLDRADVILACSHTHTGPVVRSNLLVMYALDEQQQELIRAYARTLEQKLIRVVGEAIHKLEPAELTWGIGYADFAVNRRNNKEADAAKLRAAGQLHGPVDHDASVLAVRDLKGKLQAIVFGYACHATVLSDYQWSGDYPGYAQLELEKSHPGVTAMFWAGCGADQNPLPRRSAELAERYGKKLATSVDAVFRHPMESIRGTIRTAYQEIDLPFADLPTREEIVKDAASANKYVAARAKFLLSQMEKQGPLQKTYPYPVLVWRLGADLNWIALGGEVVVDYSLRLKREIAAGHTWVAGYANDVMAYIPSLRVLREGGYEGGGAMVYYGLPAVWAPSVEERIVAAVHSLIEKTR